MLTLNFEYFLIKLSIWHSSTSLSMSLASSTPLSFSSKSSPLSTHPSHTCITLFLLFILIIHYNLVSITSVPQLTCGQRTRVFMFAWYCCSTSAVENKKLRLQTFHFWEYRMWCRTRNKKKLTVRNNRMAGGHSKHRYTNWWEILLLKTYSFAGRVCDFWCSSVRLCGRLGRPDDC